MKAPDHHPYLTEGDLRTAEDALEWLDTIRRDAIEGRALLAPSTSFGPPVRGADADAVRVRTLHVLHRDLAERLDRERRQACRRGALERWRRVRSLVRWAREAPIVRAIDWRWGEVGNSVWWMLRDCLAFRAAARAR